MKKNIKQKKNEIFKKAKYVSIPFYKIINEMGYDSYEIRNKTKDIWFLEEEYDGYHVPLTLEYADETFIDTLLSKLQEYSCNQKTKN